MNSLPKTVTRQCRDCDLNSGPSAPESSTLTTRLPSHPLHIDRCINNFVNVVPSYIAITLVCRSRDTVVVCFSCILPRRMVTFK